MKRLLLPAAVAVLAAAAFVTSPASAQQTTPFPNCPAAYAAGRANIPASDPAYAKNLDEDSDGVGCENPPPGFVAKATSTTAAPTTTKAGPTTTTARKAPSTTAPPVRATPNYTG